VAENQRQQQQQQHELPALYAVQEQRSPLGPASQLSRTALQQLEMQAGRSTHSCAEDGGSSSGCSSCKPAVCAPVDATTALTLGVLAWQQQSSSSSSRCVTGNAAAGSGALQGFSTNRSCCSGASNALFNSGGSSCCSHTAALKQRSASKPLQQPYQQCLEQVQEHEVEGAGADVLQ
jgi:hypothetical protein